MSSPARPDDAPAQSDTETSGFTISNKPTPKRRKPKGEDTANILALVTHIRTTPAWNGVMRFNQLTEVCEVWPPFPPQNDASGPPRALHDPYDILMAMMYFQANGFPTAGKTTVWDALITAANEHPYHPVRDYLNALRWDGTERVGKLFQQYFKAQLPPDERSPSGEASERDRHIAYLEHISIGFMVGSVARVMQPGCKHDHVPVAIGHDQGMQKSRAIQALCHDPAWFFDNMHPDITERDTKESIAGKWIVELAEIPHVRRDAERLKAFLSSSTDRYRAAYGRANQDHPRQSAFIGTSNDLEFTDVTGNRRFWPFVTVGMINIEAILRDRDQLWAEAVTLYRHGVQWWLPPNIEKIAAERQEAFVEADIWDGIIAKWQALHPGPLTMEDLFAKDTGITPYRETAATQKADEMRAARCLKRLGWYGSRCTLNGKRAYWWQPRPKPSAD